MALEYPVLPNGRADLQPTYAQRRRDYYARNPNPAATTVVPSPLAVQPAMGIEARADAVVNNAAAAVRPTPAVADVQPPRRMPGQTAAPAMNVPPLDIAALNAQYGIQPKAAPDGPIYQPAERGNYNMYNTDRAALAKRAAGSVTAFAPPSPAPTPTARSGGLTVVGTNRLDDQLTSDDPFERRAARLLLEQQGNERLMQMRNDASLQRTELRGQYGLADTELRGQYGLADTELRGQYGLTEAEMSAAAQLARAQYQAQLEQTDPTKQLAAARLAAGNAALTAGDAALAYRAYGIPEASAQPTVAPKYEPLKDALGNQIGYVVNGQEVRWTPAQIQEARAASQLYTQ